MSKRYNLTSTPMIFTPGIVRWGINGYRFKKDRAAILKVFVEGYNLPDVHADTLLSGRVPHVVNDENGTVSFAVPA